jgi:hypothetical protein
MCELVEIVKEHAFACCDLRCIGRLVVREPGHEADFYGQRDTIASLRAQRARIADSLEKLKARNHPDRAEGAAETPSDLLGRRRSPWFAQMILTEATAFLSLADLARGAALEDRVGRSAAADPVQERLRLAALADAWHAEALRLRQLLHPSGQPELAVP